MPFDWLLALKGLHLCIEHVLTTNENDLLCRPGTIFCPLCAKRLAPRFSSPGDMVGSGTYLEAHKALNQASETC